MSIRLRKHALLCAVALLAGVVAVPSAAQAQNTLIVQVGAGLHGPDCNFETGAGCVPGEGMRFYAPTLNVHKGDTITFRFEGFHTATLLPANTDVHAWVADNAGGVGKPWSFVVPDPDDTAADGGSAERPSVKGSVKALFPSGDCAGTTQTSTACVYDGSDVANSGGPFGGGPEGPPSFSFLINANPGDTVWAICLIHPHMRLRIKVVPNSTAATTQAQVDAARDSQIAQDSESAASLHNRLLKRQSKHTLPDGTVVWDAWAGFDNHWISLLGMYPRTLRIKKGQTVRWHFTELVYEDHSATFPIKTARDVFENDFLPLCDPDGDAGAGPDTPPTLQGPPFCSDLSQLEFDIRQDSQYQTGDGRFTGADDYENSGIRGAAAPSPSLGQGPWDLTFPRVSPDAGFKYMCLIHGDFMRGRVIVRRR